MNFRKDINGLRGLAVLLVVLFHFKVTGIQSGFIGVDVFFVISGYLMTFIIFNGIQQESFSLINFYLNRGRRIIPALAFLCFVLLVYGWFYMLPTDYAILGKHATSSLGFFSNIVYYKEAGYFDASAYTKWLLHTWSLSVEWQFYIFYPVLVLLLSRLFKLSVVRTSLVILACLSLLACIYISSSRPSMAFYLLPTRAWEMLAGGIVYLFPLNVSLKSKRVLELFGLFLIVMSALIFRSYFTWPSGWALIPVLGTALIIAINRSESPLTGNPFIQWIGTSSYSIYLWHWPVVILFYSQDRLDEPFWKVFGILISLVFGYLSYTLIEKTTRDKKQYPTKIQFLRLASVLILIGAFGGSVYHHKGFENNFRMHMTEKQRFLEAAKKVSQNIDNYYHLECDFNNAVNQPKQKINSSCTSHRGKDTIFLWGDSTTQALSTGVHALVPASRINQVATSACPPDIKFAVNPPLYTNAFFCNISNHYALDEIKELKPSVVISSCSSCYENTNWNNIANYLYSLGVKHFILVGPGPGWASPNDVVKKYWKEKSQLSMLPPRFESSFTYDKEIKNQKIKSFEYISVIDTLCQKQQCINFIPETHELLTLDGTAHYTPHGSIYVVKKLFANKMTEIMGKDNSDS